MRRRWLDDDPLVVKAVDAIANGRTAEGYKLVRRHKGPSADNVAAGALILLGRLRRAERRLRAADPERVNYALFAALFILRGDVEDARALLAEYPAEATAGFGAQVVATVARRRGLDVEQLLDMSDWRILNGVGLALAHEGAYAEAIALYARGDHALHAYNAACAAAVMGDADGALRLLATVVDRGWEDAEAFDSDASLASLRTHPGWAAVRARLGEPTPRH